VWQEGFHPVAIVSDEIMLQKMEYLHNNPVARGLVAAREHWRYSSAHEDCAGVEPVLRCDPWRSLRQSNCADKCVPKCMSLGGGNMETAPP